MQEIMESLSGQLRETIYSEKELRWLIKLGLFRSGMSGIFEKTTDLPSMIEEVFEGITAHPVSVKLPYLSESIEIDGIKYFHAHGTIPSRENVASAVKRHLKVSNEESSIEMQKRIIEEFFSDYKLIYNGIFLFCEKKPYEYVIYIESGIESMESNINAHVAIRKKIKGEYVITVPTERTVESFIGFYRRQSEVLKRNDIKIWVVNPEEGYMDPLIGYPRDFTLISRFKNPKVATMISSMWRTKVDELD